MLGELELSHRMMPRDVTNRWNSTYDMLKFSLAFREALDTIMGEKEMKLWKYEMDEEEWEIARQLCEVLKVSFSLLRKCHSNNITRFSRTQLYFSRGMESQTWRPLFLPWTTLTKF